MVAARVDSARRISFTRSMVMPGCFHDPWLSPRSPKDKQRIRTRYPREAYKAIVPPARQTKSAACALTTRTVFRSDIVSIPDHWRRCRLFDQSFGVGSHHTMNLRGADASVQQSLCKHG